MEYIVSGRLVQNSYSMLTCALRMQTDVSSIQQELERLPTDGQDREMSKENRQKSE